MKSFANFLIFICLIPLSLIESILIGIFFLFCVVLGSIFIIPCIFVGIIIYFFNSIKEDYEKVHLK